MVVVLNYRYLFKNHATFILFEGDIKLTKEDVAPKKDGPLSFSTIINYRWDNQCILFFFVLKGESEGAFSSTKVTSQSIESFFNARFKIEEFCYTFW